MSTKTINVYCVICKTKMIPIARATKGENVDAKYICPKCNHTTEVIVN